MQIMDIGYRTYVQGAAVATLSFQPLLDRAAIVTDLRIENPSAADNWIVAVAGKEIFRTRVNLLGFNNLFGQSSSTTNQQNTLFTWAKDWLNMPMDIPVPQGTTISVTSVGGATADIMIEAEEVSPGDISPNMMQHFEQTTFLMPIEGHINANVAAVGLTNFDTQVAPAYVPVIFTGTFIQPGFRLTCLALWLQAEGTNTFSGAANHQSVTNDIRVTRNGQQLFSRATPTPLGLPLLAQASAGGSANSVFEDRINPRPPFQRSQIAIRSIFDPPWVLNAGDTVLFQHDISGDVTGGALYQPANVQLLVKVERTQ